MIDAAKINNTALFKCLLQNGANVNAVDSDGISALTYAVAVGNTGHFSQSTYFFIQILM